MFHVVQHNSVLCAKAFDRVNPSEMVEALARTGIDGKDIRITTELYWNQKAAIRVDQELSEPAAIQRGLDKTLTKQTAILPDLIAPVDKRDFRPSPSSQCGPVVRGIAPSSGQTAP
ncbi:hypothetical protein RRG08_034910 [Elysia crispata]|uniref:Uncharacterized protein n=1 Tax=Elysia crispata TaxID=231223 RepID=A0AAE0YPX3_9GAST|nr:hypothetical protein RRG08_034910 [Elysia crispata]